MQKKTGIVGILLLVMLGSVNLHAQNQEDKIIALVNEHRKPMSGKVFLKNDRDMKVLQQLPAIGKAIYSEDSAESAALGRKIAKSKSYPDEMVYRRALGLQGVVDVDLKVFRFKAKTFKEVLSKISLDLEPSYVKALKDTEYTDIGYAVTKGQGYTTVLIGISKRYVDFIPGTFFQGDEGGIYKITVSGHSRLKELYYDTDMNIPESGGLSRAKPTNKKYIALDKNGNFTITVPTTDTENRRGKILGYFDKNDNLVAYNPLYGFSNSIQDSAR